MEKATQEFSTKMTEMLDRLVKKQFDQLTSSVEQLNSWQQENKANIQKLTEQYSKVTEELEISSASLKGMTESTSKLVSTEGKLAELVSQTDRLLGQGGALVSTATKIESTSSQMQLQQEQMTELSSELNAWSRQFKGMEKTTITLINSIDEFKDFNSNVWKNYREEMEQAVAIIRNNSSQMNEDLDKALKEVNYMYTNQLRQIFSEFDRIIVSIVEKHNI